MKFLFRNKTPGTTTSTSSNTGLGVVVGEECAATAAVAIAASNYADDDSKKTRHRTGRQKQQKRRESLVDMEVPLARSTTTTTTTSSTCSHGTTSSSVVHPAACAATATAAAHPRHVTNMTVPNDISSSTLSTTHSSSVVTYRVSSGGAVKSTRTSNGRDAARPAPEAVEKRTRRTSAVLPAAPVPNTTTSSSSSQRSRITNIAALKSSCAIVPPDTTITDSVKNHAFQLVPNIHKELGMLHGDFDSIQEATAHFTKAAANCNTRLKPILVVDVELPGNLHAGRTIFSHPLVVEAVETYFIVVATPHDTLQQQFHASLHGLSSDLDNDDNVIMSNLPCSKMRGNYVYTRIRILDPLTACDLVPCVDDRQQLTRASLLQAMMDALAMVCPDQPIPRYLSNLLEEEQGTTHAAAIYNRRHEYYRTFATTTTIIAENYVNLHHHMSDETPQSPMAVFGLEHTSLGEVIFAELDGVLSTQCAWVIPQVSGSFHSSPITLVDNKPLSDASTTAANGSSTAADQGHHHHLPPGPPDRQAVILVTYDPQRLSYCTLAKFAVRQHALGRLGRPSCLTFYYASHEQQVAAQMHTRAHYRQLMDAVDPTNPARHYYAKCPVIHETIRIVPLQQRDHKGEPLHQRRADYTSRRSRSAAHSSASSTGSSSEESFTPPTDNTKNNSINKTHPGYKVPDYDDVVAHAAAKAAAEAAAAKDKAPRYSFVLKTMCCESLQLQCSKPALRESHLRFVPLTPFQATRANQLVYQGKFHLAMQLLSPRQGMVLMHALRSGKPKKCMTCSGGHIANQRMAITTKAPAAASSHECVRVPPAATSLSLTTAKPNSSSSKTASPHGVPAKTTSAVAKPILPTKVKTEHLGTKSTEQSTKAFAKPNAATSRTSRSSRTSSELSGSVLSKGASKGINHEASPKTRSLATPRNSILTKVNDGPSPSTRRLRRASTTEGPSRIQKFPRQPPRMSLNTEALRDSAKRAAEAIRLEESAQQSWKSDEPDPPVTTIYESPRSSSTAAESLDKSINKSDIVYKDVVDVPILEAWKAFVVLPEGWTLYDEEDDDSYLWGMKDVYSQLGDDDRNYYTSDDANSISS